MNTENNEFTITTSRLARSLMGKVPGLIAGTSLILAFALVGAILAMAVQTEIPGLLPLSPMETPRPSEKDGAFFRQHLRSW